MKCNAMGSNKQSHGHSCVAEIGEQLWVGEAKEVELMHFNDRTPVLEEDNICHMNI